MKAFYRLKGWLGSGHYKHIDSACTPPGTGRSLLYVAPYCRGAELCYLPLASPSILLISAALPPLRLLCPGSQICLVVSLAFTAHSLSWVVDPLSQHQRKLALWWAGSKEVSYFAQVEGLGPESTWL